MTSTSGVVATLARYPVKSMQGELLEHAEITRGGVIGDRQCALRSSASGKILSAKNRALGEQLLRCAAVNDPALGVVIDVGRGPLPVTDRAAVENMLSLHLGLDVTVEETRSDTDVYESWWPELPGTTLSDTTIDLPVAMSTGSRSFVDLGALHLVTTASLDALGAAMHGAPPDVRRFRPNIVIESPEPSGFVENHWGGRVARLGGAVIRFASLTPRCIMTTLAQDGLDQDGRVLRAAAEHNKQEIDGLPFACLGIYAEVVEPGRVSVGDNVRWV